MHKGFREKAKRSSCIEPSHEEEAIAHIDNDPVLSDREKYLLKLFLGLISDERVITVKLSRSKTKVDFTGLPEEMQDEIAALLKKQSERYDD